jgi:hypothetical protein
MYEERSINQMMKSYAARKVSARGQVAKTGGGAGEERPTATNLNSLVVLSQLLYGEGTFVNLVLHDRFLCRAVLPRWFAVVRAVGVNLVSWWFKWPANLL